MLRRGSRLGLNPSTAARFLDLFAYFEHLPGAFRGGQAELFQHQSQVHAIVAGGGDAASGRWVKQPQLEPLQIC